MYYPKEFVLPYPWHHHPTTMISAPAIPWCPYISSECRGFPPFQYFCQWVTHT